MENREPKVSAKGLPFLDGKHVGQVGDGVSIAACREDNFRF